MDSSLSESSRNILLSGNSGRNYDPVYDTYPERPATPQRPDTPQRAEDPEIIKKVEVLEILRNQIQTPNQNGSVYDHRNCAQPSKLDTQDKIDTFHAMYVESGGREFEYGFIPGEGFQLFKRHINGRLHPPKCSDRGILSDILKVRREEVMSLRREDLRALYEAAQQKTSTNSS